MWKILEGKEIKVRFSEANFMVRKWRTNDDNLRNFINAQENIDKELRNDGIRDKVLGIVWKENENNIEVDIKSYFGCALKRLR